MVTSTRSMSDLAQTVSCERLPQRIAARMERSCLICATRASSASVNFFWVDPIDVLTLPRGPSMPYWGTMYRFFEGGVNALPRARGAAAMAKHEELSGG